RPSRATGGRRPRRRSQDVRALLVGLGGGRGGRVLVLLLGDQPGGADLAVGQAAVRHGLLVRRARGVHALGRLVGDALRGRQVLLGDLLAGLACLLAVGHAGLLSLRRACPAVGPSYHGWPRGAAVVRGTAATGAAARDGGGPG